jgi:hypothetical protein
MSEFSQKCCQGARITEIGIKAPAALSIGGSAGNISRKIDSD